MNQVFIGMVADGKFTFLSPRRAIAGEKRLTTIAVQEARLPETGALNLSKYEGKAIAVQGIDQGDWIYSASVIDTAGPLVTALVEKVFGLGVGSS
jgi:hypothetical protein